MPIRAALCQYDTVLGDKPENVRRSLEWIDRAGTAQPDVIVLPELVTTGYAVGEAALELAEDVPGPVTELWAERAGRYGCYIIAGLARRDPRMTSVIYNSAVLIDRQGNLTGVYSKAVLPLYLHTWKDQRGEPLMIEEPEIFRRGDDLPVFKTDFGTVGIQICQDSVYPEFTRVQTFAGASVIFQILNGPSVVAKEEEDLTPSISRVHAYDNGVFIVLANKCGTETYSYKGDTMTVSFRGESHVADPYGRLLAKAKVEEPDLLVVEFDPALAAKAQWDSKFIRDWRPELVAPLARRATTLGG